ncbi:MAG: hypothetical protein R3E10_18295 [Gemmatimonadota bacterium]
MLLRRSHLRAAVAAVALFVYAAPAGTRVLAGVGHGASHLVATAGEQRRVAARMGLSHESAESLPGPQIGFVHQHGSGVPHAHGGPVGALLEAAETEGDGLSSRAPDVDGLNAHLPSSATRLASPPPALVWTALVAGTPSAVRPAPPGPPPRA